MRDIGLTVNRKEREQSPNWVKLSSQIKDLEEQWNEGRNGKIRIIRIPPFLKSPYETNFYGYYQRDIEHLDVKKGDKVPFSQDFVGNRGIKFSRPFQIQNKIAKIPKTKGTDETLMQKKKREAIETRHDYLEEHKNDNINYGICIGAHPENNEGYKLSVIDIDGYTNKKTVEDKYKNQTAKILTDILMKIPGTMKVQTPSGGVHLYLWQKEDTEHKEHYISERLSFPKDFEIKELQNQSLKGSIEIFTNERTRQIVLPGSTVKTADGEIKEYKLIGDIDRFSDIAKVDNVHEAVKNTLLEQGYTFNPKIITETVKVEHSYDSDLDKDKIVSLLSPVFEQLAGSHNDSYLALGGILLRANVSREDATEIVQRVLNETNDDEIERHLNQQVLGTYNKYEEEKGKVNLTGFPKLKEQMILNDFTTNEINTFELSLNIALKNEYEIRILVEEKHNGKIDIVLDYLNRSVTLEEWKDMPEKDEEGNIMVYNSGEKIFKPVCITRTDICAFVPIEVNGVQDIIDPDSPKKTKLKYCIDNMTEPQEVEGDDVTALKRELRQTPDLILRENLFNSNNIVNFMAREFKKKGLYKLEREPAVSGVFLDKKSGKLFIKNTEGKTHRPIKPEKEDIIQAVCVISKLFEHFSSVKTANPAKLAYILRHCMLLPFSYIIKNLNRKHLRLLLLAGESDTAKSSMSEIGLCFYNIPKSDFNKTNGESIKSEAQLGEYFEQHGWGLLVDEGAEILTGKYASNYLEFFKSAIESKIARKRYRGSKNTLFKSYSNLIITSNEIPDLKHEDVKRISMIDFDINDVIPPETHKQFAETFNIHGSYETSDFSLLSAIGDWFIWYLDKHQELFLEDVENISIKVLEAMFKYIDTPILEGLFFEYETWTTGDFTDEKFDNFRIYILKQYNSALGNEARNYDSETMVSIQQTIPTTKSAREKMKEELWRQITNRSHVFLEEKKMPDCSKGVVIRANLKKEMVNMGFDSLKCTDLQKYYSNICDYEIKYTNQYIRKGVSPKGIHISFDDFFKPL